MADITIFGAGIIGLATAAVLLESEKKYNITIAARDLPGDAPSQNWASPWACAGWVPLGGPPHEQSMQLAALTHLLRLAESHPESSVRRVQQTDVFDVPPAIPHATTTTTTTTNSTNPPWFADLLPHYTPLSATTARYTSAVLTPAVFLPWLRRMLEAKGVRFLRVREISALRELRSTVGLAHDVLVNASGGAAAVLEDVQDTEVVADRTYVTVVESSFQGGYVRRGEGVYTYVFGRGDGTAVVGGVSEPVTGAVRDMGAVHEDLFQRVHESLPDDFPSPNPADYKIVGDLVGIRPLRPAGVRVEREVIGNEKVVHAYGTTIGGYIHSFGLAREAARLVEETLSGGM